MTKQIYILIGVATVLLLTSCGSYKSIPYFQDLSHSELTKEPVSNYTPLTIQPADMLNINVSSRNPESSAVFNNAMRVSENSSNDQAQIINGYLVDEKGEIQLPLLGKIKVAGNTTSELRERLTESLLLYYKEPIVKIRITNFKVSVFGDVQRPDIYSLLNERTTITQALSLAGDLNITAMRKNVILIREQDGQRNYIPIDLTSKKLFESPYYYLRNNDEIYVQADRTKYSPVDRGYRTAAIVIPAVSTVAIILSIIY